MFWKAHCRWTPIIYLIKNWLQGWIILDTGHPLLKLLLMSQNGQVLKHSGHSRIIRAFPRCSEHFSEAVQPSGWTQGHLQFAQPSLLLMGPEEHIRSSWRMQWYWHLSLAARVKSLSIWFTPLDSWSLSFLHFPPYFLQMALLALASS